MLQRLNIINYAIIDRLEIVPDPHLNIVTGETGAGKSIIVGALSLILGERADSSVMINKEEKSVVEGVFDVRKNESFKKALREEGLDDDDECIIRREITAVGKSRAFVNDTPVTLTVLTALTSMLVDLHRQFDNLTLEEDNFQLQTVDAISNTLSAATGYAEVFMEHQKVSKRLQEHKHQQQLQQKDADYKQYLLEEFVQADFKPDEIEQAELQLKQISQSEKIISVLEAGKILMSESELPIVNELTKYYRQLQTITDLVPALKPVYERLLSVTEELKDIANELQDEEEKISMEPEVMEALQQRLDLGYKLLKKHGVKTTGELLVLKSVLEQELRDTSAQDEIIAQLTTEEAILNKKLLQAGAELSDKRRKAIHPFAEKVTGMLPLVGMPDARFDVQMTLATPSITGMDNIQFLLDANKSGQFRPLRKAASGGELSRIMLCIKSLTANALQMPVLIFDEVDTGISGEAARQVGKLLRELSGYHQVICITHQPQVAAKGTQHFYVFKESDSSGRLTTRIKVLKPQERVQAIARMIGGEHPGEAAMSNARELIG